ncbi:MAG: hypothetical protein ACKVS9_01555 [Phycisphaerae bacterium]
MSMRVLLITVAGSVAGSSIVSAQIAAQVIAKIGDAASGSTISALNAPFPATNGRVGFVASLADTNRIIWFDNGPIFNSSSALPNIVSGGESTMGVSETGAFIYSPTYNSNDSVYTSAGELLSEDTPLANPAGTFSSFNSRPTMAADGTPYWVGGWANTVGGASVGRLMLTANPSLNPATINVLLKSGDLVAGFPINASGIGFDYDASDSGVHRIHFLTLTTGSTANDLLVWVDGNVVAQEGSSAGGVELWATFGVGSINDNGDYLFSGNTNGVAATDETLVINGNITDREGDVVDGVTLGSTMNAGALNNCLDVVTTWASSQTETLFYGDGSGLSNKIASVGDSIDINGDTVADFTITDFEGSRVIGPGYSLGGDGRAFVEATLTPSGGGAAIEAIVAFRLPICVGDTNGDEVINLTDLSSLLSNFGVSAPNLTRADGDLDCDGDVDLTDLSRLLAVFGSPC